jgi:hypothetical protein
VAIVLVCYTANVNADDDESESSLLSMVYLYMPLTPYVRINAVYPTGQSQNHPKQKSMTRLLSNENMMLTRGKWTASQRNGALAWRNILGILISYLNNDDT